MKTELSWVNIKTELPEIEEGKKYRRVHIKVIFHDGESMDTIGKVTKEEGNNHMRIDLDVSTESEVEYLKNKNQVKETFWLKEIPYKVLNRLEELKGKFPIHLYDMRMLPILYVRKDYRMEGYSIMFTSGDRYETYRYSYDLMIKLLSKGIIS